jgi:hypothetical protein
MRFELLVSAHTTSLTIITSSREFRLNDAAPTNPRALVVLPDSMKGSNMPDEYDGVTTPDPERELLIRSVFRPSPLEDLAEAVAAATEDHRDFYVERRGDEFRWSFATKGGPYPLLRLSAQFLRMDYSSLEGFVVGSQLRLHCPRDVRDGRTGRFRRCARRSSARFRRNRSMRLGGLIRASAFLQVGAST